MNKDFKVAVVTGASSGIGAEVVKKLASMQFMVVMLARDLKKMNFIADECPEKFRPYKIVTDLKDTESVENAFLEIKKEFKNIDFLCSVAGVFQNNTPIAKQIDTDWQNIIETNVTGVMRCIRAAWPILINGASIVNVGSVLGEMAKPNVGAYAVSKAGLASLTRTIASEGAKRGIRANLIIPGMVKTPMNQKMANASGNSEEWWKEKQELIPLKRAAHPKEIADAICWFCKENSSFITGAELRIDGGVLLGPIN